MIEPPADVPAPSPAARPAADPAPAGPPLLEATDLHKAYGPRLALRGLSFALRPGRILGFLGPNGAGKTTAIRILTTSLEPTSGTFRIGGVGGDRPDEIRRRIGVLPEGLGFPKHLTGLEYLVYFGRLYGQSGEEATARSTALLADVGLSQRAGNRIGSYSRGMRQRLGIARALINDPAVVFLDEPTLGLDPRGQQELLALIRRIAHERHASIVLCSHQLPEIEGICDDVVILNLGQVVAAGPVAEVLSEATARTVHIRVEPAHVQTAAALVGELAVVAAVRITDEINGRLAVELRDPAAVGDHADDDGPARNQLAEALVRAGVPIVSLGSGGSRLQDLFLELTDEAIS